MSTGNEACFRKRFKAAVLLITIGGMATLLIPLSDFRGSTFERILAYTIGAVFWLATIAGYASLFSANKLRKILCAKNKRKRRLRMGALCFFRTNAGKVADIGALLCIAALIVGSLILKNEETTIITLIPASLLIIIVQLHAILNGENFIYMKSLISKG